MSVGCGQRTDKVDMDPVKSSFRCRKRREWGDGMILNFRLLTEGQASKDLVHEALKCLCCVTQSKWHTKELKQTKGCRDCCLGDICWLDWDLVLGSDKVEF